jgi:hypothetical protein
MHTTRKLRLSRVLHIPGIICVALILLILTSYLTQAATPKPETAQRAPRETLQPAIAQVQCTNKAYLTVYMVGGERYCFAEHGDLNVHLSPVRQFCTGENAGYLLTRPWGRIDYPVGLCFMPGGTFTIDHIYID